MLQKISGGNENEKIALFSMLTFSVLSLSLAGCGNKTASTNDSKPKQETKKATQKSSSQQEMKSSHSSVTGQNSNVTGKIRQKCHAAFCRN